MKGLSDDQQDSGECSPRRDVYRQHLMKLCASVLAASRLMHHTYTTHVTAVAANDSM